MKARVARSWRSRYLNVGVHSRPTSTILRKEERDRGRALGMEGGQEGEEQASGPHAYQPTQNQPTLATPTIFPPLNAATLSVKKLIGLLVD